MVDDHSLYAPQFANNKSLKEREREWVVIWGGAFLMSCVFSHFQGANRQMIDFSVIGAPLKAFKDGY